MNAFAIYGIVRTVTDPSLGYGIAGFFTHILRLIGGVG